MDLIAYRADLSRQVGFPVRRYCLVDGLLYARVAGEQGLVRTAWSAALFDQTPDAALAHAGPWLLDMDEAAAEAVAPCLALADSEYGCCWIYSGYPIADLAESLRSRLNLRLPDGKTALLRYYDARNTVAITGLFTAEQRSAFFAPVQGWWVQRQGQFEPVYSDLDLQRF